jgi:hypothetical protein
MRQNPAAAVAARTGGPCGGAHDFSTSRTHWGVPQSEVGLFFGSPSFRIKQRLI